MIIFIIFSVILNYVDLMLKVARQLNIPWLQVTTFHKLGTCSKPSNAVPSTKQPENLQLRFESNIHTTLRKLNQEYFSKLG
ncbi:hypothetical protein AAHE18_01G093700 [Arachis hypogaea]